MARHAGRAVRMEEAQGPREGGERMCGAPRGRSARRSRGSRSIDSSSCLWFASRATRRQVASNEAPRGHLRGCLRGRGAR